MIRLADSAPRFDLPLRILSLLEDFVVCDLLFYYGELNRIVARVSPRDLIDNVMVDAVGDVWIVVLQGKVVLALLRDNRSLYGVVSWVP